MLPIGTYLYANDKMTELLPGGKLSRKWVPYPKHSAKHRNSRNVERGFHCEVEPAPLLFVLFRTGDFCVVANGHQFANKDGRSIQPTWYSANVDLAPLPRKRVLFPLFSRSMEIKTLLAMITRGDKISVRNRALHKLFFKLAISGKRLHLPLLTAHVLRSVVDAFGYNLICCELENKTDNGAFKITWRRDTSGAIYKAQMLHDRGIARMRISMLNGRNCYVAAGVKHCQPLLESTRI